MSSVPRVKYKGDATHHSIHRSGSVIGISPASSAAVKWCSFTFSGSAGAVNTGPGTSSVTASSCCPASICSTSSLSVGTSSLLNKNAFDIGGYDRCAYR